MLSTVFSGIYTLRNQIIQGSATRHGIIRDVEALPEEGMLKGMGQG